ncbi:MAG: hypothetical protein J6W21_10860 [Bacteroidaceae bacterium]|nr:hypothetical protein [Bacteroidaceae bacterium]
MKRKLFQILLMGAVTVTLGMFVSCKDTSGDLEKEFNGKFADYATLQQAMQQHQADIANLQALINDLQSKICKCDPELMQKLKTFMTEWQKAGVSPDDLKNMKALLDEIEPNYQTILNFVTNVGVTKDELDSAMNVLRGEMPQGGDCPCDLARIDSIEKKAIQALNLAQDASNRLVKTDSIAKAAAQAAQAAADAAQAAADAARKAGEDAEAADSKAQSALDLANELKSIAEAADALSKENKESIIKINNQITTINNRFVSISDSLQNVYNYADSILVIADANKMAIEKLDSTVKADKAILDELKDKIPGLEDNVNTLFNKVDSLGTEIENLKPEIIKLYNYADANLDKAKAYTDLEIALLRAEINGMEIDLEPLRKELLDSIFNLREDLNNAIAGLSERIDENTLKIGEVDHKLDSIAENFKDSLAQLRSDLSDLEKRVQKNEEDILDIYGQLENLKENLKRMVTGIIVQGTVNPAFGTLNLPVNVQSNVLLTYYGEANTDIQFPTNSTANYVDDRYVLSWKDLYLLGLNGSEPIFKAGDKIMQNDYYNAGTLYLTVNPNTVDFSKLQLTLVNSQDVESYVKLGELKRSDKVLQFGYSRAADNGFYECYANVAPEDVTKVQTINANVSGLKDDIKEMLQKPIINRTFSLRTLAVDFAELVKSLKLDANAVKCEWEDADNQKHAVYSNYNVAATAFKPISLTSYKDLNVKKVYGYDHVVYWLDQAISKVKNDIHVVMWDVYGQPVVKKIRNFTVNRLSIIDDLQDKAVHGFSISKEIEIDGTNYTLGLEDVNVPIIYSDDPVDLSSLGVSGPRVVISGSTNKAEIVVPVKSAGTTVGYASVPAGNVVVKATSNPATVDVVIANQTITVNKDATTNIKLSDIIKFDGMTVTVNADLSQELAKFWDKYKEDFVGTNTSLEQLKAIVNDVNKMLDLWGHYEDKADAIVDSYKDWVMNFVNHYNNKFVNFTNNINLRLQPIMFATDASGAKWLSESEVYPTVLGQNIDLIATTWSLELLAPLAKKHVGITNVINGDKSAKDDDATCLAELKRVNGLEKLNKVLPGDIMRLTATDLKSGYVYEIAYSGLDFHGKIATRKYYIRIK